MRKAFRVVDRTSRKVDAAPTAMTRKKKRGSRRLSFIGILDEPVAHAPDGAEESGFALGALPSHWKTARPAVPIVALRLPREQLHRRISRRVEAMFSAGLADEVRALRERHPVWSPTAAQAIGYAETAALLDGTLSRRDAAERIAARTRQLAKRQETWFRHQTQTLWLDINDNDPPEHTARRVLELWRQHGPVPVLSP